MTLDDWRKVESGIQPQQQKSKSTGTEKPANQYEKDIADTLRTEVDAIHAFVQEYKASNQKSTRIQWIMLVFTVFTFLTVFAYTTITAFQWSELVEANRINREALTSVQRAFVSLKGIEASYGKDSQGRVISLDFRGVWENSGITQTRTLRQHASYDPRVEPLPKNYDFPDLNPGNDTITFVASKATIGTGVMAVPLVGAREIQEGKRHLYFWGWAAYRDVFQSSRVHLTEFCLELATLDGDIAGGAALRLTYNDCPVHNCTDENCTDYDQAEARLTGNKK